MNRTVISFWKRMSFKHNINKMRQAVVNYLKGEGIQADMKDGAIQVRFEDFYYMVEFDLEDEYPRCDITFRVKDEDYVALELSRKTFIADKANTDEWRLSTVKAFNETLVIDTQFYFVNKDMLLSLFYTYFTDLKATVDDVGELFRNELEKNEEKKEKRPIGFTANVAASKKVVTEVAACNGNITE